MIKTPCLNSETLGKYVLGMMDDAEMQNLERHLIECHVCCDHAETLNPIDEVTKAFGLPKNSRDSDEEIVSDLIQRVSKLRSATTETCSIEASNQNTPGVDKGDGESFEVQPTDLLNPPQGPDELGRLGDYRILKILGTGGMGFVFLAEDERLRRRVALKVMKPSEARKKGAKDRFLREARATAAVEHDNVITIHQVGEDRGIPFIAMPMLQGASLKTILQGNQGMAPLRAISICRQVAAGLFAAHQTGLIHRDIKPDNLWIESTKERVKILDFGLVRNLECEEGLTLQGTVLGTPSYMSPEQAAGELVDHRSDLFSLGAVFYQMLSGRSPYAADTLTATLLNVARANPTPVESLVPGLDPELIKLVSRLNALNPNDRPQSADEVDQTLERIGTRLVSQRPSSQSADAPIVVSQAAGTHPARKPPRTPWGKYAVAGGAAAAFLMAITFFVQLGKHNVQITLDDPTISLKIDGEDVLIDDGKAITRLSAGLHQLTVQRDGLSTVTDEFSVEKDGKNIIHVSIAEGRLKINERDVPALPETPASSKVSSAPVSEPVSEPVSTSDSGSSVPDVRAAQWMLSQEPAFNFWLQSKKNANDQREYFPGDNQPLPTEPYHITSIFLSDTFTDKYQDATASQVAPNVQGLRDLKGLRIESQTMTSAGFAKVIAIPEFSGVSEIQLSGSSLDDRVFEALAKLPNLTHAHLSFVPNMTGEGIGRLSECSQLEMVGWTIATPTVQSMNELSQLPYLNGLALNGIECTEQHALAISKLKLRELRLYGSKLDDAMVRHLAKITQLEILVINDNEITDVGLQELHSLQALKQLHIQQNLITTAGIEAFQHVVPQCKILSE